MKCTIQNHTNCRELNRVAKHKVYQRRYGQYTMVAADVDEYQTVIGSNVTTHKMGASKHVVLRLPTGTYANFNNVKVFGNASDSFDHFTVHNPALSFDTNGNDLDILDPEREKQEEKDNHRPLVKPIDAWDLDTIIFWLIVFLVVIGALTTGIYLLYRSKVRNDIRDLHEEFEFFYKGEPRE
uniref:Uncharacterized protein n=1 Tax=Caenorhabditis japonica TaxID=281687 RepID=A0A8R1DX45_CAEJA